MDHESRQARRPMAELLDKEPVQFALIIAAGILPLALAVFVPRAIDRVRLGNRGPAELVRHAAANAPSPIPAVGAPAAANSQPRATAPEPLTPDLLYRRGKERRASGDYLGAICDFDRVLRAKPEFVWCYYERAGAYSLMGNQQAALADLDRAIVAMPVEAKVWRARAVVHQRMRDLTAAVRDIGRALELVAENGDKREAAFANRVQAKAEKLIDELTEHATASLKSGQYQGAIDEFNEVLLHRRDSPSAWLRRAAAYDALGQFDKALDDLNVALALRPGPAQAFALRSMLHERNEDYTAALTDIRAAQQLDPARREYAERIHWLAAQRQVQERARQLAARWRAR